ncbi:hypothetical protein FACS1894170_12070 [Planctomycetales bacterium]|nr:hypothetical protein FACS1894170_12070 [Planctomycetales bacterium]
MDDVPRPSKTCSVSQREFLPGEEFYSVLTDNDGLVVRADVAAEHWIEPPEHCLAWWKTTAAENVAKKNIAAPNEALLQFFNELSFETDNADVRYVLTLLLLRRRSFRLDKEDTDEAGHKVMFVTSLHDDAVHQVAVAMPNQERLEEIQQLLSERTGIR